MIARKCDRCGGSYEVGGNVWSEVGLASYEVNEYASWEEYVDHRDLCPECMKDFGKWLSGEEKQTGWINVEDRLPEEDVPVLVCYIGAKDSVKGDVPCTDGMAHYHDGEWCWWDSYGEDNDNPVMVKITHWMPLPDPPGNSDAQA